MTRPALLPSSRGLGPRAIAYLLAAVLTLAIGYDVWRTPVQVHDALAELLAAQQSPSVTASFAGSVSNGAYLRPLRIAQIKALFDLSQERYQATYRGFHVLLLIALVWLFVRALRVRTWDDAAAAAFALVVLTGLHTFLGFVREAFPINHFLEIAVFALVALNLAQSAGGWVVDVLAAVLLAAATLTLESGVLIWVVVVATWLCGLRGVSRRGLAMMTVVLAGYFVLRFLSLSSAAPTLSERSSGFLLRALDPPELQQRFGAFPWTFYLYNVAASVLSILFSEPVDGVFIAVRRWLEGNLTPRQVVALLSSAMTTLLIAWALWSRWRSRIWEPDGRLFFVGMSVLAANTVLSFAYTKSEIVAVAGVFYAMMSYAAARTLLERSTMMSRSAAVIVAVGVLLLSGAWTMRSYTVHEVIYKQAFRVRNDWAEMPIRWTREGRMPTDAAARALLDRLRTDALTTPVRNPQLLPRWSERWFGD